MTKLKETKILGMPLWMYIILLAVVWIIAINDAIPGDMVRALCFATVVGTFLGFIGDRIPIWKDWLGGDAVYQPCSGWIQYISYFTGCID